MRPKLCSRCIEFAILSSNLPECHHLRAYWGSGEEKEMEKTRMRKGKKRKHGRRWLSFTFSKRITFKKISTPFMTRACTSLSVTSCLAARTLSAPVSVIHVTVQHGPAWHTGLLNPRSAVQNRSLPCWRVYMGPMRLPPCWHVIDIIICHRLRFISETRTDTHTPSVLHCFI